MCLNTNKTSIKYKLKRLSIIFFAVIFPITIRVFIFDIYSIPSQSMTPTLVVGDYIVINKMTYGSRLLNLKKLLFEKHIQYWRLHASGKIQKGDVVVFNFPKYSQISKHNPTNIFGGEMVKRIAGLPGEIIKIKNTSEYKKIELFEDAEDLKEMNAQLFPNDTALKWTVNDYGPVYIPAKGDCIDLNKRNISLYKDILKFENPYSFAIIHDVIAGDGVKESSYTFKHDYYFVLGDNFYFSKDSRYWGFVPKVCIVGKAKTVIFSWNSFDSGINKIRWNRLFKMI